MPDEHEVTLPTTSLPSAVSTPAHIDAPVDLPTETATPAVVPETTHDDVPHVPSATVAPTYTQNDRARAIDVRRKKKEGKLQKILEYVREHGSIVNDEIQEVADCADNTALLYAKALVKRGELVAKGKGVGTRYVLPVNMSAL